jgi:hypothetical protein
MSQMTGQDIPGWVWDPNAGSHLESGMAGGSAMAGWVGTLGGLSNTGGLLNVTYDENGNPIRSIDKRVAATTAITVCAGAANGAAALSQIAGPGGAIAGTALGMITTAVSGGFAAYDAQKAIAQLKLIHDEVWAAQTSLKGGDNDLYEVSDILGYCIGKQGVKRNKGIANASLVGQPLGGLYKSGKAIDKYIKGTKGQGRTQAAKGLLAIAKKNTGPAAGFARRVIETIAAKNFENILTDAIADAMKSG